MPAKNALQAGQVIGTTQPKLSLKSEMFSHFSHVDDGYGAYANAFRLDPARKQCLQGFTEQG
jgi:hypothetical protein